MKRTAAALMLIAGLGGGCMTTDKTSDMKRSTQAALPTQGKAYMGPHGEPVQRATARGQDGGVTRADGRNVSKSGIQQVENDAYHERVRQAARGGFVPTGEDGTPGYFPGRGILPVPAMGPYGAVAAVGAMPAMGMSAPINARTSVRFGDPHDMRITWYGMNGLSETVLTTPARYNFSQGGIYRLKLSNVGKGASDLYPTLEVAPATPKTATYLAHASVPVSFTDEDFEQVMAGNFLVKVIYLPDPQFQDLAAVAGPAEVISTRLEPGMDPVAEARKRGEILLIVRMGNIELDAKGTPPLDAPTPFGVIPPRMVPMPSGPMSALPPDSLPDVTVPKPMPKRLP